MTSRTHTGSGVTHSTMRCAPALVRFGKLDVRDRLRLGQEVVEQVPVKPAVTNTVHISFDYWSSRSRGLG